MNRTSTRLGEIEMLRAIAVGLVLLEHMPLNLLFWPTRIGGMLSGFWTGVDLFFAISGFVIARSLLPRLAAVRGSVAFIRAALEFWIRRAWRLLPSAWFWLTAPLLLCLVYNRSGAYGTLQSNWEMFVSGILYMANFRIAYVYGNHGSGAAFVQWSLSLEEQFYIMLPFAAYIFRRYLTIPLLMLALFGFFITNSPLSYQLRLWPVAMGVLLAIWSAHQTYLECEPRGLTRLPLARLALLVLPVACLVSLGTPALHIVPRTQGPIAFVSVFLVWLASYDRGYLLPAGPTRRLLERIGARSYSIYLVHIPIYFGLHETWYRLYGRHATPSKPAAAALVITALILIAAVAECNHRLLEMPLRERGKMVAERFAARKQALLF